MIRLRLIGQMEAWTLAGDTILAVGRKTRALLAVVALSSPRPVLRERLADLLWSRRPEEQARASLRQEIHRLLAAFGPQGGYALVVSRDHVALTPGSAWIDVEEVLRATAAKPGALTLLDGELLEDLNGVDAGFDGWLTRERERLRDKARGLAETLLRDQDEPDGTIAAARQLLAIDSSHEGAWRALMRSYAGCGERGMAVQAYERCRVVLGERLQTQPSEETQRLLGEIRASGPPRAAAVDPQTAAPPIPPARAETSRQHMAQHAGDHGGTRVGVLPLQLIGTTATEAQLGGALAEEITSALARFRWMSLVSSGSLARFAAHSRDETEIGRAFDMHVLLDGSIQLVQDRLRISLRLLDLRAGNQVVWSRRFDRVSEDLLTLQDEIAGEAAAQIDAELLRIEAQRAAVGPVGEACADDLVHRALPLIDRLERPLFLQAGELLRQAIAQERDHAGAHAGYAYWYTVLVGQGWTGDVAEAVTEASRLAERAIMLEPQDAKALAIAGHIRAFLHLRLRDGIAVHERALTHNPNLAMAWSLSGLAYAYLGELAEAERRLLRYKRLSPTDPRAFFFDVGLIVVALLRHDHEAAVTIGRGVGEMNPASSAAYKPYLAALGHLGHTSEAATLRARLLALEPGFTVTGFLRSSPFERAQDRDHYAEGLRRAGVPE